MNYALAYKIGFHPWEDAEHQEPFKASLSALLDDVERGREPPFGTALDLGTGSGIWGTELARRGWDVTGVDNVERALARGRERAREAELDVRFVCADVTDLRGAGVGSDFDLVLDTGTFHGLGPDQRAAMGSEVGAVTAPGATVLLLAWRPRRRGPLPRGVTLGDIESAFPAWRVSDAGETGFEAPKPIEVLLSPDERWYRLRRR